MKKKKKYIKPTSELIQVSNEGALAAGSGNSLDNTQANWGEDSNTQAESSSDKSGSWVPNTPGDLSTEPGSDIGAKVNPWGAWDE